MELDDYLRLTEEIQDVMARIQSILAYNMSAQDKQSIAAFILIAKSKLAELQELKLS